MLDLVKKQKEGLLTQMNHFALYGTTFPHLYIFGYHHMQLLSQHHNQNLTLFHIQLQIQIQAVNQGIQPLFLHLFNEMESTDIHIHQSIHKPYVEAQS